MFESARRPLLARRGKCAYLIVEQQALTPVASFLRRLQQREEDRLEARSVTARFSIRKGHSDIGRKRARS
jgi:hypothetical protein